jgi:hypothetical protein
MMQRQKFCILARIPQGADCKWSLASCADGLLPRTGVAQGWPRNFGGSLHSHHIQIGRLDPNCLRRSVAADVNADAKRDGMLMLLMRTTFSFPSTHTLPVGIDIWRLGFNLSAL